VTLDTALVMLNGQMPLGWEFAGLVGHRLDVSTLGIGSAYVITQWRAWATGPEPGDRVEAVGGGMQQAVEALTAKFRDGLGKRP
jgi:hypothetical protein